MHATVQISSERQTVDAGVALAALLEAGDVVLLSGDLGAGKTRLAKGIARGLGIVDPVTSPTFNILVVHRGRLDFNHVDLYRLDTPEQLEDIDYFGIIESGGVTVVEWGDRFAEASPEEHVSVRFTITGDEARLVEVAGAGERGGLLAREWVALLSQAEGFEVSIDS